MNDSIKTTFESEADININLDVGTIQYGKLEVGTTTTGEAGTEASVTNRGSSTNAILDFTIPKGEGVPIGGKKGQVLVKSSENDYDTMWTSAAGVDLSNYYNKEETNELLDGKANTDDIPDVSSFITESEVDKKIDGIVIPEGHTHTNKAILDSITQADIDNWNEKPTIPTKVSELENDSKFATESYVDEKVASSGGGSSTYELPIASADTLGGIKVGANLSIDADGVLSASSSGGNAAEVYSTEEQVVGTWLGKPRYRKTFVITEITTTPYQLDISSLDAEEVLFDIGHSYFSNPPTHTGTVYTLHFGNYASTTDWGRMYWGKGTTFNRIDFQFGESYATPAKIVATIEYTKTTD